MDHYFNEIGTIVGRVLFNPAAVLMALSLFVAVVSGLAGRVVEAIQDGAATMPLRAGDSQRNNRTSL